MDWPHFIVVVLFVLAFGFAIAANPQPRRVIARFRDRIKHRIPQLYRIARRFKTLHIAPGVHVTEGLRGKRDGKPYYAFVIHNRFGDPPEVSYRWETHFVFESGIDIGRMIAEPTRPDHRVKAAFGAGDLNFESAEFSDAYYVRAEDSRSAYAFLHPRMIEQLLEHKGVILELAPGWTLLSFLDGDDPKTPLGDAVGLGFAIVELSRASG